MANICFAFRDKGRCKFGTKCRFSHDPSAATNTPALDSAQPNGPASDNRSVLRKWRDLMPKSSEIKINNGFEIHGSDLAKFFKQGWDLVSSGDADSVQQVVASLATDTGLWMIRSLVEFVGDETSKTNVQRKFKNAVLPFFKTISHTDVLSSLLLETQLETIFTFLYGPGGRRAVALFTFTASMLRSIGIDSDDMDDEEIHACFDSTLVVLEKILDLIQHAQFVDSFSAIIESISTTLPERAQSQRVRQNVTKIRRRLGLGALLPEPGIRQGSKSCARPVFQVAQDLPGKLSKNNARHDNDHQDIYDIEILPTTQEILSDRQDYLPFLDPSTHHLPGLAGLVDRQFRLLREDTIGPLRDEIRREFDKINETSTRKERPNQGLKTLTYQNVHVRRWDMDRRKGLQLVLEFDQPNALRGKSREERAKWWTDRKALQPDTLVCLVSGTRKAIFLSVCDPEPTPPYRSQNRGRGEEDDGDNPAVEQLENQHYQSKLQQRPSLDADTDRAQLMLRLVNGAAEDVSWLTKNQGNRKMRMSLVEFPGVLLPSFQPILNALKHISRSLDVAFAEIIAPAAQYSGEVNVPSPAYTNIRGFAYDIKIEGNHESLKFTPGEEFDMDKLRSSSALDEAQQDSFIHALSTSLALIQGPPGTGKSYTGVAIIKTLLASRDIAKLGPIICVCYTNHALDQLLEHLLKDGVKQIIRVGSRSKSEILSKLSLRHVTQQFPHTKHEAQQKWKINTELDRAVQEIEGCLANMSGKNQWTSVKAYLRAHDLDRFREVEAMDNGVDNEGFQTIRKQRMDPMQQWIFSASPHSLSSRTLRELENVPLQNMSIPERQRISQHWVDAFKTNQLEDLLQEFGAFNTSKANLDLCHQEVNLRCMLQAHVIGVTTSGLARNLDVLRRLRAKVLVCEEAGEVLEAHTLTALLPSIEHAIFIGDHEQLRPQTNNHDLQHDNPHGQKYSLDVSLFERLVRPPKGHLKVPYATLRTQRRMDPSIANLMRATLYPDLVDHSSVTQYPHVDGMKERLFWLDHGVREDRKGKENASVTAPFSKTNAFEVEMVAALVSHLIRQTTFEAGEVAVLTPYLGQLRKIRERLASSFEIVMSEQDEVELDLENARQGDTKNWRTQPRKTTLLKTLRLSTVDNFQGEEAKVVVISLVRCNDERKCGFLKTSNRINVLLSRAKHGMYIIGNTETASPVDMWADVLSVLKAGGNVGTKLALCCPRHKDSPIEVSTPDDFVILSPEGGCNRKCVSRLPCGHACPNKCHAQGLHNAVHCNEPCLRVRKGCEHVCSKACGDACDEKCQVMVSNIRLPCGHVAPLLKCHQAQVLQDFECQKGVETKMKDCDHVVQVPCHELRFNDDLQCPATCGAPLLCGHECRLKCKGCRRRIDRRVVETEHGACISICRRPYTTCNHSCASTCHGKAPCSLCEQPCEVQCSHSRCRKKCNEPCVPCVEKCAWRCPHQGACPMPCAVPCDLLPCSLRCPKTLPCGHQCPSTCGEICPDSRYCQQCASDSVKDMMVDYIMYTSYADVDLDESPCIVPSCGHILTVESMDGHMSMPDYYESSPEGTLVSLKSTSVPFSEKELKSCGTCRRPLRDINRYSRIVRRAWIDEATKKFIVWANSDFVSLASKVSKLEKKIQDDHDDILAAVSTPNSRTPIASNKPTTIRLENSTANIIKTLRFHLVQHNRLKPLFSLQREVKAHAQAVDEAEQPFGRIHDLARSARITQGLSTDIGSGTDILQVRNRLLATVLLLRVDFAILQLFSSIHQRPRSMRSPTETKAKLTIHLDSYRETCSALERDATERQQPACVVEAALYFARFTILERNLSPEISEAAFAPLVDTSRAKLSEARALCSSHPSQTRGLPAEISAVERMLRDRTFYETVTNEEKAAVYAAMKTEFSGTGHWYVCVNGHPFTVGECGAPMETSRCPQCGEVVGGQNHEAAQGVRHAEDLEREMRGLHVR